MKNELVMENSLFSYADAGIYSIQSEVELVAIFIEDSIFAKNYFTLMNFKLIGVFMNNCTFSNQPMEQVLSQLAGKQRCQHEHKDHTSPAFLKCNQTLTSTELDSLLTSTIYKNVPADVIDEFKQSMKVNIAKHITTSKFPSFGDNAEFNQNLLKNNKYSYNYMKMQNG